MPRKNNMRTALEQFVERVASGGCSERETEILPSVLSVYFQQFGNTKTADDSLEQDKPEPAAVHVVPIDSSFPDGDTYVTVEQIARFLGLKPGTIWNRLREGTFPEPAVRRKGYTRWRAEDIRMYRAEMLGAA